VVYLKPKQLIIKDCARRFVLKLCRHEASRGLFAIAELLVYCRLADGGGGSEKCPKPCRHGGELFGRGNLRGICAGGNGRVHRQELPAISYGRKSYLVMHKSAFLHALNLWRPGPLGVDDAPRSL